MAETVIHNGQVIVDGRPQPVYEPPPSPAAVSDLDPEEIAGAMARVISEAYSEVPRPVPMEVVTRLLKLKSASGQKLVWTRFDMFQCFALWSKKVEGSVKL